MDTRTDNATIMGHDVPHMAGTFARMLGLRFASRYAEKAAEAMTSTVNEIVLIANGRVRAGFDLAKIQDSDIVVHSDTLFITLPHAEILDIIMNPSDFSTEYEKGSWSYEQTLPVKEHARRQLEIYALEDGILQKAEEYGTRRIQALFSTFGFKAVIVNPTRQQS